MKRKGVGSKSMFDLKAALNKRQEESNKIMEEQGGKTWVKRGYLEQKRVEAFMEEREKKAEEDEAIHHERLAVIDEALGKKEKPLVTPADVAILLDEGENANDDAEPPLSTFEVFERLRDIAEPVTLFGETDMQRYKRMKKSEKEHVEGKKDPNAIVQAIADVPEIPGGGGEQSDGAITGDEGAAQKKQKKDESEGEDAALEAEKDDTDWRIQNAARDSDTDTDDDDDDGGRKANQKAHASDTDTDDDDEEAAAAAAGEKKKKKKKKKKEKKDGEELDLLDMPEDEYAEQCDTIKEWLTKVMKAWENDLAGKPEEEKRRGQIKVEIAQHRQSRRDTKPLKKRLRIYKLDRLLCPKLYDIVALANSGEYRSAGEAYLELSIGKAAWPVGLGNAGGMLIEDGPGFMKTAIKEDDIAKVLRDETVRKYVQSMKRLLTIAQRYWPPADPSKRTL